MLKLYNTLTKKKEEFKPIHKGKVSIYTCGPTVYDFAHIGNLRAYTAADILRRYLGISRLRSAADQKYHRCRTSDGR